MPKTQHSSGQPAEAVSSRRYPSFPPLPAAREEKSEIQPSFPSTKLRAIERQFLNAALAGDVPTIEKLLEQGIQALDLHLGADTALHLAVEHEKEEAVRLLLFQAADLHAEGDITILLMGIYR